MYNVHFEYEPSPPDAPARMWARTCGRGFWLWARVLPEEVRRMRWARPAWGLRESETRTLLHRKYTFNALTDEQIARIEIEVGDQNEALASRTGGVG